MKPLSLLFACLGTAIAAGPGPLPPAVRDGTPVVVSKPKPTRQVLLKWRDAKPALTASQIATLDRVLVNGRGKPDWAVAGSIPALHVYVLRVPWGQTPKTVAARLAKTAGVQFSESNEQRLPESLAPLPGLDAWLPSDPFYGSQWHLARIGVLTPWRARVTGSSVPVAVTDTGVQQIPDLWTIKGTSVFDGTPNFQDVMGHGTVVASTAFAKYNNALQGCGVAPNAYPVYSVRISGPDGWATYSAMAKGIVWAADHGARVVNLSYQGGNSSTVATAARYLESTTQGVLVAAAGNANNELVGPDVPEIVEVAATAPDDTKAWFSCFGARVDLSAPGVAIYASDSAGGFQAHNGTSFASPIVAGAAALIIRQGVMQGQNLTAAQVRQRLLTAVDDLGPPGRDPVFGVGRLNLARL